VSILRTQLAAIPLALMIGGFISPAYSQSESKTGVGQRGTPVAPSTDPSQAGSTSTPRRPPGMAKGGTPVAQDSSEAAAMPTAKPSAMGNTKPDPGKPAEEKSIPSSAPAATTTQTTGANNQSKTVKTMNEKAKSEVETEGK
jgi:hypothetical protein